MEDVSSPTFAPRIVLIAEPERKIMNVGILCFVSSETGWEEGNVRCNAILLRDGLLGIDVDFCECDSSWLGVFRRQRFVGRRDRLARCTPICVDCGMSVCAAEVEGQLTVGDDHRGRAQQLAELCRRADIDCGRHRGDSCV